MLLTIFFSLLLMWFAGLVSNRMLDGYVHVLVLLAVFVLLVRVFEGRRPLV